MFEGKPPSAHAANSSATGTNAGEQLHTLSWSDLVAKLEAARDLRAALANGVRSDAQVDHASFDAHSAHHLAEQQEPFPSNSEFAVNPLDSANRKDICGKQGTDKNARTKVSRGRK